MVNKRISWIHILLKIIKCYYYFFFGGPHCVACGILVPWPGIEPVSPALEVPGNSHNVTFSNAIYVNMSDKLINLIKIN